MSYCVGDNIIAPLGMTAAEVYDRVLEGQSSIERHDHHWHGLAGAFCASLFTEQQRSLLMVDGLTLFASLVYRSACGAIEDAQRVCPKFSVGSPHTLFVISTTKADTTPLSDLDDPCVADMGQSSREVALRLGVTTEPLVVSNACVSGLSALSIAHRLLSLGIYRHAIVCGVDVQTPFVVSGFQSLRAISDAPCRPFDSMRHGMNPGEAAATMVLSAEKPLTKSESPYMEILNCVMRNDAHNITSPAPSGEGLSLALQDVTQKMKKQDIAFICAHGTATLFNDQMEAMAITKADLGDVPVFGLKGYVGHTMGAAGVLETILSMRALRSGIALGTKGMKENGLSVELCLSSTPRRVSGTTFVKTLSGFGGSNAAMLCRLGKDNVNEANEDGAAVPDALRQQNMRTGLISLRSVHIDTRSAEIDGKALPTKEKGAALLTELYRASGDDYPRFFKMDGLCRLGFVAAELLMRDREDAAEGTYGEGLAVVLFSRSASTATDRRYWIRIVEGGAEAASPSLFAYTLPNIVTGEIAIRWRLRSETCLYVLPSRSRKLMAEVLMATFSDLATQVALTGWVDYEDAEHFEANIHIVERRHK